MSDVFLSYAREDGEFVRRLHNALEAAGRESWVDWEGIPPTAEWMEEIHQAIDAADTFVAVLSPSSVGSEVCRLEVEYAAAQGKRLVPVIVHEVEAAETPEELAKLNWLFFRDLDDFDDALAKLTDALDLDLDHLKLHTWLLVRCGRWRANEEENSFLLAGRELETAESWLADSADKQPEPTQVQSRFILEGRRRETRRQQRVLIAVAVALVVSVSLGLLAWVQRNTAERQRKLAVARSLATQSELALDETSDGLIHSALLAVESLSLVRTDEGDVAWERAMKLLPPPPLVESPFLGETTAGAIDLDGVLWAAGDGDGNVTVGEIASGQIINQWRAVDTKVESLAFDSHASLLAVGGREVLRVWDIANQSSIAEIRQEGLILDTFGIVHDLAFSHDGKRLYAAAEGFGVDVFSTEDWRRLEPLATPDSRSFALARHPTRELLAVGGFGLTLVEPGTGHASRVADERDEEIDTLAFSREGDMLGTVDIALRTWDIQLGTIGELDAVPVDRLATDDERALSLDFSPGGRYLAVARESGRVHVRAAKTGEELDRVVEGQPVQKVWFGTGADNIVTISDRLRVREALTGDEIYRADLGSRIRQAFFVGGGKWLVATTADGRLHQLVPDGLQPLLALELGQELIAEQSPDEGWLAAMGADELVVFEADSLDRRADLEMPDSAQSPKLLFDSQSKFLVATGRGFAWMLDLTSLQWNNLVAHDTGRASWEPAFTEDGRWLVLAGAGTTRLFRPPSWESLPQVSGNLKAFDPQGARSCTHIAAVRGRHPGYQVVWDLLTGEELGSVGLLAYQGRTAAEFGKGDVALAERCEEWVQPTLVTRGPEPFESARWRVEHNSTSLLLFALQPEDRIAEACRRLPRQFSPEEWTRFMGDEPYRSTCPDRADPE